MALKSAPIIRKATLKDVPRIRALVNHFASEGRMLPLSLNQIYEHLRDFWVIDDKNSVVACAALKVIWKDLGEIRSLAVSPKRQKSGYGRFLIDKAVDEARALKIKKLFALTYVPDFFRKMGFVQTSKGKLPHKIWLDCINCPKFPRCDEVCLIKHL